MGEDFKSNKSELARLRTAKRYLYFESIRAFFGLEVLVLDDFSENFGHTSRKSGIRDASHFAKVTAGNHKSGFQNHEVAVRSASRSGMPATYGQSGCENHKVALRLPPT